MFQYFFLIKKKRYLYDYLTLLVLTIFDKKQGIKTFVKEM